MANGAWRCSRSIPANGVSQRQKQEGGLPAGAIQRTVEAASLRPVENRMLHARPLPLHLHALQA